MATSNLDGTGAEIEYTPTGGTAVVHTLAVKLLINPIQGTELRRKRALFRSENVDGTVIETFKVGAAVFEAIFTIRFDDEQNNVEEMLRYGLEDNVTLTYRPDGITDYPLKVVSVAGGEGGDTVTRPDRDLYGGGRYEARFTARRIDGSDLSGLF